MVASSLRVIRYSASTMPLLLGFARADSRGSISSGRINCWKLSIVPSNSSSVIPNNSAVCSDQMTLSLSKLISQLPIWPIRWVSSIKRNKWSVWLICWRMSVKSNTVPNNSFFSGIQVALCRTKRTWFFAVNMRWHKSISVWFSIAVLKRRETWSFSFGWTSCISPGSVGVKLSADFAKISNACGPHHK